MLLLLLLFPEVVEIEADGAVSEAAVIAMRPAAATVSLEEEEDAVVAVAAGIIDRLLLTEMK